MATKRLFGLSTNGTCCRRWLDAIFDKGIEAKVRARQNCRKRVPVAAMVRDVTGALPTSGFSLGCSAGQRALPFSFRENPSVLVRTS
jgi:hypothetical protein